MPLRIAEEEGIPTVANLSTMNRSKLDMYPGSNESPPKVEASGDVDNSSQRPPPQLQVNTQNSQEKIDSMFAEGRLQAKRAPNRPSPARNRRRMKAMIQALEASQDSLRSENTELRTLLEAALLENRHLRRMMEEEQQVALERNRALQRLLERHLRQSPQEQRRAVAGTILPSLVRTARSATHASYRSNLSPDTAIEGSHGLMHHDPIRGYANGLTYSMSNEGDEEAIEACLPSRSIIESDQEPMWQSCIHTHLSNNAGNSMTGVTNGSFYEEPNLSHSMVGSGQGVARRNPVYPNRGLTSNEEDTIRILLKIQHLQHEIDALKKTAGP